MRAYQILEYFDIFKEQNKKFHFLNIAQELPKNVEVTHNRIDFDISELCFWHFTIFYYDTADGKYMKLFARFSDEHDFSEMELGVLSERFSIFDLPMNEEQKKSYISKLLTFIYKKPYLAYSIDSTGSFLFSKNPYLHYFITRKKIKKERKKSALEKVRVYNQAVSLKHDFISRCDISKINLSTNSENDEINLDVYFSHILNVQELVRILFHINGKPRYSKFNKIKLKVKDADGYKNIIFQEEDFIDAFGFLRKLLRSKRYPITAIRINFEN